jgi:beta-aspartyl-peptidase (threonine type)
MILGRISKSLLGIAMLAAPSFGQDGAPVSATSPSKNQPEMAPAKRAIALVVHGGAGIIDRSKMTPERERDYRNGLERALTAGYKILESGGASLDAVEAAVRVLEDDPLFNAGKGAVFTSAGTNELDASIMEGKTLKAGSVAGVKHIKNPISLARMVMEKSPHVMLAGEGAENFAKEMHVELVDEKYFYTEERWEALQRVKKTQSEGAGGGKKSIISDHQGHGTVGAVALDQEGNLAAATSTGGMTNKRAGRIGDSPVIGAGTYANNQTCAVSCTGDGEYFIRAAVAHEISALLQHRGISIQEAAENALDQAKKLGGEGGLIAIDKNGNQALPFNTAGMYRGYVKSDGSFVIEIYK